MRTPLIIGHRGASGHLPEHTLEAYALAISLGADYIEPDLVATKDGHLIARHEPNILHTTDVEAHAKFANRRRLAVIDGMTSEGFFTTDFTLAEIKQLRAKQAFSERPQQLNGRFSIPTLDEIIQLAKRKTAETGRPIGIYPETKHPTYHRQLGLPIEEPLLQSLQQANWQHRGAPVFIQSFEQTNLKELHQRTDIPLIQLIDASGLQTNGSLLLAAPQHQPYDWTASGQPELLSRSFADLVSDPGLQEIAQYAAGIGPWKRYIVATQAQTLDNSPVDSARQLLPATDLIERAHQAGLLVHAWTFRNEPHRLAADYAGQPIAEYLHFYSLGVDGVFADFAETALAARHIYQLIHTASPATG